MKFRFKILLCNITLIAIAFLISGYLLIDNYYQTSLEQEIAGTASDNQMIKALVEQEVINLILRDEYEDMQSLQNISIFNSYQDIPADFALCDENLQRIYGTVMEEEVTEKLIGAIVDERKSYFIRQEEEKTYLYCADFLYIDYNNIYIINRNDITNLYANVENQLAYYKIMSIVALLVCFVITMIISYVLTSSIHRLHLTSRAMAGGNYKVRAKAKGHDEIGELSGAFNQMAESVGKHIDELVEEGRRKEDFVANFTHEVKTPLTSIIGYADTLRQQGISEETRIMAASYIFSEGRRLEKMSGKLFELFLLKTGELKLNKIWLDSVVEEAYENMAPLLTQSEVTVTMDLFPVTVKGDYELLKTVIINLLDNARKASKPGGNIEMSLYKESGDVYFKITDYGIGIKKEDIDKITEAFYMADKSRTRKEGGAGLGLALVAKILEIHDGILEIESVEGEGSSIRVKFKEVKEYA